MLGKKAMQHNRKTKQHNRKTKQHNTTRPRQLFLYSANDSYEAEKCGGGTYFETLLAILLIFLTKSLPLPLHTCPNLSGL